jgi:hypothetical protein
LLCWDRRRCVWVLQVSLVPGGDSIVVTFANRLEFVERLTAMRLGEIDEQCEAIRTGMLSATIPAQVVSLWSVNEFSLAVCGKPEISIEEWTAQTRYTRHAHHPTLCVIHTCPPCLLFRARWLSPRFTAADRCVRTYCGVLLWRRVHGVLRWLGFVQLRELWA